MAADTKSVIVSTADKKGEKKKEWFSEKTGDLFKCPASASLAHCVSACLRMGKGIATSFKSTFGHVLELMEQKQGVGGCAVLKAKDRWVYYLVTKEKYWQKPTYDSLRKSLIVMRDHAVKNKVKHICMPRIGTGLDELDWKVVSPILYDVFADFCVQITVYIKS